MENRLRRTAMLLAAAAAAVLAAGMLAACGSDATPTAAVLAEGYQSTCLPASYEGAVPAATQLALGTFLLEGTADAVNPQQAQVLLPLWKSLQSGGAQTALEVDAVLRQVERALTPAQIQAIAAMQLTDEDLAAWLREHGRSALGAAPPDGTPRAVPGVGPRGTPGPGGQGGSVDARETVRAGFDAMSEEERAQVMATMQAGGAPGGGPGGPAGQAGSDMRQFGSLLPQLIELLAQRADS